MGEARKVASVVKVKSEKEVILEAQKEHRTVHFATLMDICHLNNADLEPKCHQCKGWVVLRGDVVTDDSGAHAVLTEQGSSASQMTAAKVMAAPDPRGSRTYLCASTPAAGVAKGGQPKPRPTVEPSSRRCKKLPLRRMR